MRKLPVFVLMLFCGCVPTSQNVSGFAFAIEVYNPLETGRKNVLVRLTKGDLTKTIPDFDSAAKGFRVVDREAEIANEYANGAFVVILDSMKAKERRSLNVYYVSEPSGYRKRTQAELSHKVGGEWKDRKYIGGQFQNVSKLSVPPEHKDHSLFIRYEGPGWESDLVGYRLYLDQRNAIDVFGKKTNDMVLMGVGQDGFASYHELQSWGMDVMKVGGSLGLGSLGMWVDTTAIRVEKTDSVLCAVRDGSLSSSVSIAYHGWDTPKGTVDVSSWLYIHAGTRWTLAENNVMGQDQLCTGIVKDVKAKLYKSPGNDSTLGYIATYGKQSLNDDKLGLALLFDHRAFSGFQEDANSHIVELQNSDTRATTSPVPFSKIDYYFAAAWEQEPGGITNEADFMKYVERSARELANPVVITVKEPR